MRSLATGQVGIGTATPTSSLHVTGDMRTDGALRDVGNAAVRGTLTVGNVATRQQPYNRLKPWAPSWTRHEETGGRPSKIPVLVLLQ